MSPDILNIIIISTFVSMLVASIGTYIMYKMTQRLLFSKPTNVTNVTNTVSRSATTSNRRPIDH